MIHNYYSVTDGQNELKNTKMENKAIAIFLFFLIFCQRIVIPLGSSSSISIILFVVYIFLISMMLRKKVAINGLQFILYLISSILVLTFSLFQHNYSVNSLFYFIIIYLPFIFALNKSNETTYAHLLNTFRKYMFFCAILGILQFISLVLGFRYIDYLSLLIPQHFLQSGYNTSYPIAYGSTLYKSNGLFFLEPSFFSQFLAIAFIIEIYYYKRILRSFIYLAAMLLTFSGTGFILVAISLIPIIFKQSKRKIIFILMSLLIVIPLFLNSTFGQYMINRLNEFNQNGSSASVRFITPYKATMDIFNSNNQSIFIGAGPGSADRINFSFRADFSALPKLFLEYGIFEGLIFTIFLVSCFFRQKQFKLLSFVLFIMYLFLSGNLLQPQIDYFFYLILILVKPVRIDLTKTFQKRKKIRKKIRIAL